MEENAWQKTIEMVFVYRQLMPLALRNAHSIEAEDSLRLTNTVYFSVKWDEITLLCWWANSTMSHQSFLILPSGLTNFRKRPHYHIITVKTELK